MERTPPMPRAPSLGQRLAVAALVGLIVLAVLLTVASATASSQGRFTFATARAGDRWSYSLEPGAGWSFGPNDTLEPGVPSPAFDFAWTPVTVRLADGDLHAAARLDVSGISYRGPPAFPGRMGDDGRHWAERGDYRRAAWVGGHREVLALEVGGFVGSTGGWTGMDAMGVPVFGESSMFEMWSLRTDYDPDGSLCLADLTRPGETVDLDAPLVLSAKCHLGSILHLPPGLRFKAGPVETVLGVSALRFDAASADVHLWYSPSIPYPVQVVAHGQGDEDGTGDGEVILRMTGFQAGTSPLPVQDDLAARDPVPPLDLRAAQPWGPDDADAGFEFPLAEAFARARDDPDFTDLRLFLDNHDGVFAWAAQRMIEDQQTTLGPTNRTAGQALHWWVTLGSKDGCFAFAATRQTTEAVPGPLPLPLPPLMEAPPETSYRFQVLDPECDEDAPAPPAIVWPTIASALAQWRGFASPDEVAQGASGWGFELVHDEDGWHQHLGVGHVANRAVSTRSPLGSSTYSQVGMGIGGGLMYLDGAIDGYARVTVQSRSDQHVAGLHPSDVARQEGNAGGIVQPPSGLGDLDPVQATGIGLLAALAGLGYLAWSSLKAGALAGFFSRLATPDLLQHPVRKELVQRIEAQPGVHYQDLVRAMGKGKGTVEHHLRKLEDGGLVKSVPAGGYTCFFPVAYDRRLTAAAPALKSEGARKVLAAIRANPGSSALQVSAATGLSPAAINHHLRRLGEAGLVDVLRNGRSLSLQPTALASQVDAAAGA